MPMTSTSWTGTLSATGASGNQIYSNVVTGTVAGRTSPTTSNWFESAEVQKAFSIQTPNSHYQGTAFISLIGNRPSSYWDLTANMQGASVKLAVDYDGGWSKPVKGEIIENPTARDLWLAADRAVLRSGDRHHIYLEIVSKTKMDGDVQVYDIDFGS